MTTSRPRPALLAAVALLHLLVTTLAWRDLRRRPATGIRGSRRLWRALTALNTTNSLLYLLVGVRR